MPRRVAVSACLVILLAARPATAADKTPTGWQTPMGTHTALDAAKRIFPGATFDPKADALTVAADKALRMLGTTKERASVPEGTTLSAPTSRTVKSEGKTCTVLLWEGMRPDTSDEGGFGEQVAVLAVFAEGSIEPIDVAEVKADRETSLGRLFPLGADQGFTVLNEHHNSNQQYQIADVFHLRGGRLRKVASVFTLSSSAGCDALTFEEGLQVRAGPSDAPTLPPLVVSVDLVRWPPDSASECKKKTTTEHYEDRFRWDATKDKYVLESGTIKTLDTWNEKSM